MRSGDFFQRWRVANQEAVRAAKAMFEKLALAVDGEGEPPSQAEAEEVKRLRHVANDLFDSAMARLGEAAHQAAGHSH